MAFSKNSAQAANLSIAAESLEWNKRSLPIWMEKKTQGKLAPDAETLATSERNIEECGRVVARIQLNRSSR